MKIELYEKPKGVTIIEGFPGFGLVGTISTEFLLDHLKTKLIGKIWLSEMPAIAAIHQNKVVQPLSIHYSKKHNLVIVHGITATMGIEWKIADALLDVAKQLSAKQIISLEGIGSNKMNKTEPRLFYYSNKDSLSKKFASYKLDSLNEGIIMGVTGALLIKNEKFTFSCLFAETASNLPDSRAAARVITVLAKHLSMKIDTKPLLKQAEKFEVKLKQLMQSTQRMAVEQKKKQLSYMG